MACPTCNKSILFGGKKFEGVRYCSKKCLEEDELGRLARKIPDHQVEQYAAEIMDSLCPVCESEHHLDVHKSYFVYSVILMTSWETKLHLSCKSCAAKKQRKDFFSSFLLGWWGVPFGLIMTPVQLVKNLTAMAKSPDRSEPSEDLKSHARQILALNAINNNY